MPLSWYVYGDMPMYEYRCADCAVTYEVLRPMNQRNLSAVCPNCESRASMPLISQIASSGREWTSGTTSQLPSGGGGGCCGGGCGCN